MIQKIGQITHGYSLLTDFDIHLFKEGNHAHLYEKLGAHVLNFDNKFGTYFAVWAPSAEKVSVIGDFNNWDTNSHPLAPRWDSSGIWEGFIPELSYGTIYKYHINSNGNFSVNKGDPFALLWEIPSKTGSIIWNTNYTWYDNEWMKNRHKVNSLNAPMSIYEIHPGSWRRVPEQNNRYLTYRELADYLVPYIKDMGFTHVEFLPIMEHPFYGSWGYQTVGYFAPTSRFGTPQDFMYLIDCLHQNNIGVILDWVPSHFPTDEHGLSYFDGTHLYEHSDPRKGFHPDWKSYIFNHGRHEVRNYLMSSAMFWLDKYHVDGLRIDAVASMLYLDYSRKEGEWIPNEFGGRENLPAITFIKRMNELIYQEFPDVITIAEESTAWPMVTRPTYVGGLGFGMKWNMGWMHDTLVYATHDPIYRKYHHDNLTFSIWYAFSENFLLPFSHDEVVHGKGSLINKMPGETHQKFANLKLLFGYMYTHPGKKLVFMGGEFGVWDEWNHEKSLDWHLLQYAPHQGMQKWMRDLNNFYKNETALYELDFEQQGFEWIDFNDYEKSIISFLRINKSKNETVLVICNFTPQLRENYRVGVPSCGIWKQILNSDLQKYNGSNNGIFDTQETQNIPSHNKEYSLNLTLPSLSVIVVKKV